jgi:hypothetical protein
MWMVMLFWLPVVLACMESVTFGFIAVAITSKITAAAAAAALQV